MVERWCSLFWIAFIAFFDDLNFSWFKIKDSSKIMFTRKFCTQITQLLVTLFNTSDHKCFKLLNDCNIYQSYPKSE